MKQLWQAGSKLAIKKLCYDTGTLASTAVKSPQCISGQGKVLHRVTFTDACATVSHFVHYAEVGPNRGAVLAALCERPLAEGSYTAENSVVTPKREKYPETHEDKEAKKLIEKIKQKRSPTRETGNQVLRGSSKKLERK